MTPAMGSAYSALCTTLLQFGGAATRASPASLEGVERCSSETTTPRIMLHVSTLLSGAAMNLAAPGGRLALRPGLRRTGARGCPRYALPDRDPALAQAARGRAAPWPTTPRRPQWLALEESVELGEAGSMDAIVVPALWFLAMARLATDQAQAAMVPLEQALRRGRDSGLDVIAIMLIATTFDLLTTTGSFSDAAVLLGAIEAEAFGPLTGLVVGNPDNHYERSAVSVRASLPQHELDDATSRGGVDGRPGRHRLRARRARRLTHPLLLAPLRPPI